MFERQDNIFVYVLFLNNLYLIIVIKVIFTQECLKQISACMTVRFDFTLIDWFHHRLISVKYLW